MTNPASELKVNLLKLIRSNLSNELDALNYLTDKTLQTEYISVNTAEDVIKFINLYYGFGDYSLSGELKLLVNSLFGWDTSLSCICSFIGNYFYDDAYYSVRRNRETKLLEVYCSDDSHSSQSIKRFIRVAEINRRIKYHQLRKKVRADFDTRRKDYLSAKR